MPRRSNQRQSEKRQTNSPLTTKGSPCNSPVVAVAAAAPGQNDDAPPILMVYAGIPGSGHLIEVNRAFPGLNPPITENGYYELPKEGGGNQLILVTSYDSEDHKIAAELQRQGFQISMVVLLSDFEKAKEVALDYGECLSEDDFEHALQSFNSRVHEEILRAEFALVFQISRHTRCPVPAFAFSGRKIAVDHIESNELHLAEALKKRLIKMVEDMQPHHKVSEEFLEDWFIKRYGTEEPARS